MTVQLVVARPKSGKRGHGHDDRSPGDEKLDCPAEAVARIRKMLEHVQKKDQRVPLARLEARIERLDPDAAGPGSSGRDSGGVHLDSLDAAESLLMVQPAGWPSCAQVGLLKLPVY